MAVLRLLAFHLDKPVQPVPPLKPPASRTRLIPMVGLLAVLAGASSASGQGLVLPGAGPINRSMAGASTATSVDFGSSYWNPATISGLDRQEFLLGTELIFPSIHLN